jgi:hypothetical protein
VTALQRPEAELPTVANVTSVIPVAAVRGVDVIQVTPGTSPEAKATSDLISTLRDDIILAAERGTTLRVYIGGVPATFADFATVVDAKLPWFILTIVGLRVCLRTNAASGNVRPGDGLAQARNADLNSLGGARAVWAGRADQEQIPISALRAAVSAEVPGEEPQRAVRLERRQRICVPAGVGMQRLLG